jgi:hypothetical protein
MNCKSEYSRIMKCLDEWDEGDSVLESSNREEFMKECTTYVFNVLKDLPSTSMRLIKEVALKEFYAHMNK